LWLIVVPVIYYKIGAKSRQKTVQKNVTLDWGRLSAAELGQDICLIFFNRKGAKDAKRVFYD